MYTDEEIAQVAALAARQASECATLALRQRNERAAMMERHQNEQKALGPVAAAPPAGGVIPASSTVVPEGRARAGR